MALFSNELYKLNDNYCTPLRAWEDIKNFIPKNKIIWDPFYFDGESKKHFKKLGFNIIHDNIDFFKNNLGDIIITNPPFSNIKNILIRLDELDKPFIMIMPVSKICTQYFKLFKNKIQIIIPNKRIQFLKKGSCNFDCFYYCYKINLDKDIIWL